MTTLASHSTPYAFGGRQIRIDYNRDNLITKFAHTTLDDRYLWTGEKSPQEMFGRVACANSDNNEHAQRLYNYMSNLWFMPATPVLSNSGHEKNLEISCYVNEVGDNLEEIFGTGTENNWLASRGGGIGTNWSPVREKGAPVALKGTTSGIIPFVKMQDSSTLGVSQGNLRRGSTAAYLEVSHAEIEEFLDIRRATNGDDNRRCLNVHHGVIITDDFMKKVREKNPIDRQWALVSRYDGRVVKHVDAQELFKKIVVARLETGEPYMLFIDNVNKLLPDVYKANGLYSTTSNLCVEIHLSTQVDYNAKRRTAVCCLSSLNQEKYFEWENDPLFIEDVMKFLDNVMSNFIRKTEGVAGFERARYAASMERSVGLGVMGFHSLLQSKGIAFESAMAKVWNLKMWQHIKQKGDAANLKLAIERGPCPDAARAGIMKRFAHMFSVAPTASISIICGESSPGIEPYNANCFTQKTLSGSFFVKNKWLNALLQCKFVESKQIDLFDEAYNAKQKAWVDKQWLSIIEHKGSVQHLEYFNEHEKNIFKTAFEINQEWIIEHAADRQQFICQGQSVNIFLPATVDKGLLVKLHYMAWAKGLKGLYYCRSRSVLQASNTAGEMPKVDNKTIEEKFNLELLEEEDDGICLACQ